MSSLNKIARFILVIFSLSLIAELIWSTCVQGSVYYCSDEVGFGYLMPGEWVHDATVSKDFSEVTNSMSDPDLIREGWSEFYLWLYG